jgi:hypothetical protein
VRISGIGRSHARDRLPGKPNRAANAVGAGNDEGVHGVIGGADVAHGGSDIAGLDDGELRKAVFVGVVERASITACGLFGIRVPLENFKLNHGQDFL